MQLGTVLVFAATVMPLVCTPGPDILFVASQGLSGGTGAAMRANLGVLLGYLMHALLATFAAVRQRSAPELQDAAITQAKPTFTLADVVLN